MIRRLAPWCALLTMLAAGRASAQFLYVNNNAAVNSVSGYSVNLGTGALTPVAGSPYATGGVGGFTADIDSIATCRGLVFASNGSNGTVSVLLANGLTGVLTSAIGSPYAAGACPTGLACTPNGQRLYAGDFCGNTINIFDVDSMTGALTPNAASPLVLPVGSLNPFDLEVDSSGSRLFVSQDFSANIAVYDIGVGGGLTPVAGSPFSAGGNEHGGVLSPNGAFYYVANLNTSISGYTVGGSGALTPVAGSPFATPASDLTMTPGSDFLVGANYNTNRLNVFKVNPGTGVPTIVAGSPFSTDTPSPGGLASAGGFVFVANGFFNAAANSVSVYAINGTTGALSAVAGSPFARGVASAATGIVYTLGTECGNGAVEVGEECDDGNTDNGDCCSSTCTFDPVGTSCADATLCNGDETCDGAGVCDPGTALACDDGDVCTADSCDDVGGCIFDASPRGGCLTAQKSLLLIKQKGGGSKDKLIWKWLKGTALTQMQLADPTSTSGYALCVYDGGGLIGAAALPAGARWTASPKGYSYADPAGAPDGIIKALLKLGAAGKSKALVKGKGNNLPDPGLGSVTYPVTAQLVNTESGVCLEGSYTLGDVLQSGSAIFKAKAQ